MRSGPSGPTPGIRIINGAEVWRSLPRGVEFSLAVGVHRDVQVHTSPPVVDLRKHAAGFPDKDLLFGEYLFADYSGAAAEHSQRRAIKVATAAPERPASLELGSFTRESLVDFMHRKLQSASERGVRMCLGQDHSYGFPLGLAQELGNDALPWRSAIASLLDGSYGDDASRFTGVAEFAAGINAWLRAHGKKDYFWSATQKGYGLPTSNPRSRADSGFSRITDTRPSSFGRGSPMPFSRVGDNGSVGGQSLWGISMLRQLMARCDRDGIRLRCWPFDGLSLTLPEYENAHVLVEAYPSALRGVEVPQSDEADALCTAEALRVADMEGQLGTLLDLSGIADEFKPAIRFEGWIVGQRI